MTDNPFEAHARKLKVDELAAIAHDLGLSAEQLEGEPARERLLAVLSERRGREVTASLATWRKLWHKLRGEELAVEHPGYAAAVAAESPYSTVPLPNPFARAS